MKNKLVLIITCLIPFFASAQLNLPSNTPFQSINATIFYFDLTNNFGIGNDFSWTNNYQRLYASFSQGLAADTAVQPASLSTALAGKFNQPSGTSSQYIDGTGTLRSTPITINGTNGLTQNITIGSVTSLAYLSTPTVVDTISNGTNHSFAFGIPVGGPGAMGSTGLTGSPGVNGTNATPTQRLRVQTGATGSYTWTFPTAYGSGVIPVVTGTAEGTSATQINCQTVSVNSSQAVFQVFSLPTQTLLGLNIGVPTQTQAFIDVTAIAP